ncbi:MAG: DNA methylase, partial [Lachnospiraceae bacterium]|nr:DNA methylase [Lachnospiraceae bacterium]
ITDFWRVGRGYAKKLAEHGMFTMGDVARCSIGNEKNYYNEDLLYKLFGVNAELLIDHAWGWEPTTINLIKQYKPETNSLCSGQVLQCPYDSTKAKLIVKEMTDLLVLGLVEKYLVTNQIVLTIGYDIENLTNPETGSKYKGEVTTDRYGRKVPKHAHGTVNLDEFSSSTKLILDAVMSLYDRIVDKNLLIRRITITVNHLIDETAVRINKQENFIQMDLFTDYEALEKQKQEDEAKMKKERALQEAVLSVKKKFGKNAILKGINLEEGATGTQRNNQIGGHRA